MYERLVEDWLTSSNELSYQIPFCEVLVTEGYELLHVSRHGRGEHGKDIVARAPTGELCTFQLKGGDISLGEWRNIRGEVEELVQLPVRIPGVSESEAHRPFLVTNGEMRGDAAENITRFAEDWQNRGYPKLEVWQKGTLLRKFLDAQGSFLPSDLAQLRRFVELYVTDFSDELPVERFATFLESLVDSIDPELPILRKRRALASVALVAAYIAGQYEREKNFVAAAKAWTVAATNLLYVATRDDLAEDVYGPSLNLVTIAYRRSLDAFAQDALHSEDFVVTRLGLADPFVYGVRVTIVLSWLAVWSLDGVNLTEVLSSPQQVLKVMAREYKRLVLAGEVDWPHLLAIVLFLDRRFLTWEAENVLRRIAQTILREGRDRTADGFPSPYWSHERVIRLATGMLAPYERERFSGHTYVLAQTLDSLTRRLRRQLVGHLWPGATQLEHCDFVPDQLSGYFRWRCKDGTLDLQVPKRTRSWSDWRDAEATCDTTEIPAVLGRHPEWVLPFMLSYPHRSNRRLSRFADILISGRGELVVEGKGSSAGTQPRAARLTVSGQKPSRRRRHRR